MTTGPSVLPNFNVTTVTYFTECVMERTRTLDRPNFGPYERISAHEHGGDASRQPAARSEAAGCRRQAAARSGHAKFAAVRGWRCTRARPERGTSRGRRRARRTSWGATGRRDVQVPMQKVQGFGATSRPSLRLPLEPKRTRRTPVRSLFLFARIRFRTSSMCRSCCP